MTAPNPFDQAGDYTTLRKRWYERYIKVERDVDKKVIALLSDGAESASDKIQSLMTKDTFSAKVRTAQLNTATAEMKAELHDIFGRILPVIRSGDASAAGASSDALGEQTRKYLQRAFAQSGSIEQYLKSTRASAINNVNAAIASVAKPNANLSRRVYRAESLANGWIRRDITIGILRGDSPSEVAATVRKHIKYTTGNPGGTSYAARRVAITEINNAYHSTTVAQASAMPFTKGFAWNLSNAHKWVGSDSRPVEICEQYHAKVWDLETVPRKPHPFCRCFVTPILESFDVFVRHLTAGQYRDWMENAA